VATATKNLEMGRKKAMLPAISPCSPYTYPNSPAPSGGSPVELGRKVRIIDKY